MLAYYDNLDRLRAERTLDAAQAALVPHLTDRGRKSFFRDARKRTRRLAGPDGSGELPRAVPAAGMAPFTVEGVPVDADGLKRWLATTFGVIARQPHQPTHTARAQRQRNGHAAPALLAQGKAR